MADALVDRLDRTIDLLLDGRDATAALADAELSPLAVLAATCALLSPAFKTRLRATRKETMMPMVLESSDSKGYDGRPTPGAQAGSSTS